MKKNDDIIICSCCSIDHQIVFRTLEDEFDREVFVHIHLANYRNFWQRIGTAIKYVFGYKSKYGHWDEFILDQSHVDKLEAIIKYLKGEGIKSDNPSRNSSVG